MTDIKKKKPTLNKRIIRVIKDMDSIRKDTLKPRPVKTVTVKKILIGGYAIKAINKEKAISFNDGYKKGLEQGLASAKADYADNEGEFDMQRDAYLRGWRECLEEIKEKICVDIS
jgi:hypothetical protein